MRHKIKSHRYRTLSYNLVSEYEKTRVHKVCTLWSLFVLSSVSNEKNMHGDFTVAPPSLYNINLMISKYVD